MAQAAQTFVPVDEADARAMSAGDAIQYHYDNDTRFFSLWLDPTLSYSAARWRGPIAQEPLASDLAQAQRNKIRFHIDAVKPKPGGRLLDVGCGWGAVLRAALEAGAAEAVGLTLSRDQFEFITGQRTPGASVLLQNVFEYAPDGMFDAVISIGAFEHFARPEMDKATKIATYRDFFERCHAMMRPGSRMSLQSIVWDDITFDESKTWIPETVFPQSDIPFIDEVVSASARTFRLIYLENDPENYSRTLQAWIENLRLQKEAVIETWGTEKFAFFEHYLRNSRLAFQRRKTSLARFVLLRR